MKNRLCKNTKLSEKQLTDIVRLYCSFSSASECAKNIKVSRQTIHSMYRKLAIRVAEIVDEHEFPNFSSKWAKNIMGRYGEGERKLIANWLAPSVYEFIILRDYEEFPVRLIPADTIIVRKDYKKNILSVFMITLVKSFNIMR